MDIGRNIKNNQIAWGLGIGMVVIAGFFGGVIWIAMEPLAEESSLTRLTNRSNTTRTTNETNTVEVTKAPKPYLENTEVIVGTLTNISENNITVQNTKTQKSQTFSLPTNLNIILIQDPENYDNYSEASLAPKDLRKGDEVNIYLDSEEQKIDSLKVLDQSSSTSESEPLSP